MKCLLNKFSGIDPVNFRVHLFNYFLKMEVFCAYRALDLWSWERGEPRLQRGPELCSSRSLRKRSEGSEHVSPSCASSTTLGFWIRASFLLYVKH